jgi:hypothetical protein
MLAKGISRFSENGESATVFYSQRVISARGVLRKKSPDGFTENLRKNTKICNWFISTDKVRWTFLIYVSLVILFIKLIKCKFD